MRPAKILIVEDDVDFADGLAERLDARGHLVTVARTGDEAHVAYRPHGFGLVLLDIELPGISGLDCLEALRDIEPAIGAVIMTAYPSAENTARARALGAVDILRKPLDMARLFARLDEARPAS